MRVNDDYADWNVKLQLGDKNSVFSFYQRALALRKQHDVLVSPRPISLLFDTEIGLDLW